MTDENAWLEGVLSDTENQIQSWPTWLRELLKQRSEIDRVENESIENLADEEHEEFDQQVG